MMRGVDKLAAARIDGMLQGARETIFAVVDPLRVLLPPKQQEKYLLKLGHAMTELLEVSWAIHDAYPGIDPDIEARKRGDAMRRKLARRKAAAKPTSKPKRKPRAA